MTAVEIEFDQPPIFTETSSNHCSPINASKNPYTFHCPVELATTTVITYKKAEWQQVTVIAKEATNPTVVTLLPKSLWHNKPKQLITKFFWNIP